MILLADLMDLFLPAGCAACGALGAALCSACGAGLAGPPGVVTPPPAGAPPCWAGGGYDGALRAVILAYKERRRHGLARPLGELLAGVVRAAADSGVGRVEAAPMLLVPVPSSARAIRARGGDHVRRLARVAARRLRRSGVPARVALVLAVRGRRRDSVGLDAAARRANVAGGFRLRGGLGAGPPGVVVLVDDLVTTGATLAEAARTVAAGGWSVRCAAVLAATPRRRAVAPRGAGGAREALSRSVPIVSPRRGRNKALIRRSHR